MYRPCRHEKNQRDYPSADKNVHL